MNRRQWKAAFWCSVSLSFVTVLGCRDAPPLPEDELSECRNDAGANFDPTTAGTILGRVIWKGEIPTVLPFEVPPNPLSGEVFHRKQVRPNPNVPIIEFGTRGVASAAVFLRNVDAKQGKSWDHLPVRVEQRGCQFHVVQGEVDSSFGFVRCGDNIEIVSRDRHFHSLHADGAAFFSLTFPDPDQPLVRRLKERGIVELTSATGYYWMRAYLFVNDHPYYTRTDIEGRFVLSQVPPGCYEVVCWMPNWRKARHERDPESGMIARLFFSGALGSLQRIELNPRELGHVNLEVSAETYLPAR